MKSEALPVYRTPDILLIVKYSKKRMKTPKGGNENSYIEEKQTTQWLKEKVQKDKQRSTKHTYKTNDRVTLIKVLSVIEERKYSYYHPSTIYNRPG